MGSEALHSLLSPSKRHRWSACPGSIREEAKYPEPQSDSPTAIDGTRTHEILEYCVKSNLIGPQHLVGASRTDQYGTYIVTQDRVDRVQVALDYIKSRVTNSKPIAEQRVFPDGLVGRADLHGTIDVQIPGAALYEIIDYKDGMAPVEVTWNPQLVQYALGVIAGLPEPYPETFRLTVIQPKLATRGMNPISSWEVTTDELLAQVPVIQAEAAATDDPNAPLVPGESQCKYCRAKGGCSALGDKVVSLFSAVQPQTDLAQQTARKDPGQMSDEELRRILEAAPLVRGLLDGVEKEVQTRLEAGKPVPGFKLVRGKGSRAWALPEDEMAKKLAGMLVPKSAMYVTKLVSPAQAEKLTWEKDGEVKKLSDRQVKNLQKEYITSQPGKIVVAPESDPREAVVTNAAEMFGAVPNQVIDVQATVVPAELPPWMQLPAWLTL